MIVINAACTLCSEVCLRGELLIQEFLSSTRAVKEHILCPVVVNR